MTPWLLKFSGNVWIACSIGWSIALMRAGMLLSEATAIPVVCAALGVYLLREGYRDE